MASQYSIEVLKIVVAQICQTIGWHAIQSTPLNIMVDILHKYMTELGKNAHTYAEHFGHTSPNLDDIGLAFRDADVHVEDLVEYIGNVEAVQFPHQVPKYPVPRESHLNFLKPGSREVLTRPVHVHEHLPPMHRQLEEEEKAVVLAALSVDTLGGGGEIALPASPKAASGGFKRPGEAEHHSAKRARLMMEEEGRPVREISSVMMTTSGFLSPAREGKLPEARTPSGTDPSSRTASRSASPVASPVASPSCYPTVPPDVKGDKKPKKAAGKKAGADTGGDKKKDGKAERQDEPAVKKLVSMKEFAKLKALKAGAMKQMAAIVPQVNLTGLGKIPKLSGSRPAEGKLAKSRPGGGAKTEPAPPALPASPASPASPPSPKDVTPERVCNLVEGKLSSEPDKHKLNILKKISKVKEDKGEAGDDVDLPPLPSREGSPGLVIDESELNSRRDSRMAKIETCIDAVIHAAAVSTTPPNVGRSDSAASESDSSDGSVRLRTPPSGGRRKERRKKRERGGKSGKPARPPAAAPLSPRPKTPEASPGPDADHRPPVFPFFTHFPPAPGLIPPPIGHPFFPGFPLSLGKKQLHPAMPNLALPPARFMQRPGSPVAAPATPVTPAAPATPVTPVPATHVPPMERPVERSAERSPDKAVEKMSEKTAEKTSEKSPEKTPDKVSDKKQKEHKKEKKEKDKTKEKKKKKDKLKGKERGEKKKTKEEKREKNKSKEKKEKKEKRKEKERDEKLEGSVPKLTLRINAASPRPPTPDAPLPVRRITIKPVLKTSESDGSASASASAAASSGVKREPSPELARMCALVTRPAKKSSKTGKPSEASSGPGPLDRNAGIAQSSPVTGRELGAPGVARLHKPPSLGPPHDRGAPGGGGGADNSGNKVWICPACGGQDDGSPMIGCDDCDAWYHWVCVGIQVPPDENEDWYCRVCIVKKQEHVSDKSKKKRKKKMLAP